MDLSGNTVLVTGGATGIGRAIAERFLRAGSKVIVCGRREARLSEVAALGAETFRCDVGDAAERERLVADVVQLFPALNVLVNNAGIQRRARILQEAAPWSERQREIAINFEAPVHLSSLLLPQLTAQSRSAIINVSSGLAFVPAVMAPVYAATKAALHSYTKSLRFELSSTSVRVIEIVPPSVNTDLGGEGLHTYGAPLDEFTDSVMARVADGELEVGFGTSEALRNASRAGLEEAFARLSGLLP